MTPTLPSSTETAEATSVPHQLGDFSIKPFLQRSDPRALWQLLNTLGPIAGLWWVVYRIGQLELDPFSRAVLVLPVLALLVLFMSRSFSLMHDCGHGSLFNTQICNRVAGFLLGVVNGIPQHAWSRGHAFHHRNNGNWERYRGPSALLTVTEYQRLSRRGKWGYAISRHPLMLFPGGFFYLVIKPRVALILGLIEWARTVPTRLQADLREQGVNSFTSFPSLIRGHQSSHWYTKGEFIDLLANNALVLTSWGLMARWLGAGLFWPSYATVMTISAAIFICIFFVQHNFEGSYANGNKDWSHFRGAMEGSSNLELPPVLNWFSADIGFHSIHHLCEKIPNYNLHACHHANQQLLSRCTKLSLNKFQHCFAYILWDQQSEKLVTIAQAAGRFE